MKKIFYIAITIAFLYGCSDPDYNTFSTIYGKVIDRDTGERLDNVEVTLSPGGDDRMTDANGDYKFEELEAGQYTIRVTKAGYRGDSTPRTAVSGKSVEANFQISKIN